VTFVKQKNYGRRVERCETAISTFAACSQNFQGLVWNFQAVEKNFSRLGLSVCCLENLGQTDAKKSPHALRSGNAWGDSI